MINLRISIFFISSLIFVWTCHQFFTFGDVLLRKNFSLVKVFLKLECDCDSFCTDDTELSSSSGSSSPEPGCVSSSVRDSINQMVMELKCCTEVHNTVLNSKFIFLSSLSALPLCALVTFTYISYSYFYGDLYSWIYLFHLFIWCLSPN